MLKQPNFFNFIRTPFFAPEPEPGNPDDETAKKAAADKEKQAALDKQFAERAERGREQGKKEILELLGISDPDEAKKLIDAARKADEANKSELEKEKAAREKAEKEATDAKAEAEKIVTESRNRVLNSEIKTVALSVVMDKEKKSVVRRAFRPEAVDDILLLVNREGIKEKDGKFDGVDEALKELAKAKPWLLTEEREDASKGNNPRISKQRKEGGDGESRPRIISSL